MSEIKDSLYANPLGKINAFQFDESVAAVFPDMIQRSVPGYSTIISAIGLLAERFAQPGSRCYDLGCSLGAATIAMRQRVSTDCQIVAVDNSIAMIEGLKKNLQQDCQTVPVEVHCQDIRAVNIQQASVVVLNFTMQFIPVEDRQTLLSKIYQGLLPGGILILSEKLLYADPKQQALQTQMHHLFKKAQGYSDLEISQKRSALENVLIAESFDQHRQRLLGCGFDSVEVWFQYFNFASMLALK
jgi:tRNA (cmo5U34)-methyltransferase